MNEEICNRFHFVMIEIQWNLNLLLLNLHLHIDNVVVYHLQGIELVHLIFPLYNHQVVVVDDKFLDLYNLNKFGIIFQ
jgi:hypothetical protein